MYRHLDIQVANNSTHERAYIEPQTAETEPNKLIIHFLINDHEPLSQTLTLNETITCRIVELQSM